MNKNHIESLEINKRSNIREVLSGFARATIFAGLVGIGIGTIDIITEDISSVVEAETNSTTEFLIGGLALTTIGICIDQVANSDRSNISK